MTRKEVHKILEECLNEAEERNLYGQMSFKMHFQDGRLQQITDEGWKRTWKNPSPTV